MTIYHIVISVISAHPRLLQKFSSGWRVILTFGLKGLLLSISFLYTPILAYLMMFFRYRSVHIPEGMRAVGYQELVSAVYNGVQRVHRGYDDSLYSGPNYSVLTKSPELSIKNCSFIGECPVMSDLCPDHNEMRLYSQLSLTWDDCQLILPFNVIIVILFAIGMPLFLLYLSVRTRNIISKMDVEPLLDENLPTEVLNELKEKESKKEHWLKQKLGSICGNRSNSRSEKTEVAEHGNEKTTAEEEIPETGQSPVADKSDEKTPKKRDKQEIQWLFRLANCTSPMVGIVDTYRSRWIYFKEINIVYKLLLSIVAGLLMGLHWVSYPAMGFLHLI